MRAKDIASRLTERMRQFRATSLGEFAVALIIFAAMGTLYLPLLLSVAPTPAFAVDAVWVGGAASKQLEHGCELDFNECAGKPGRYRELQHFDEYGSYDFPPAFRPSLRSTQSHSIRVRVPLPFRTADSLPFRVSGS